MAEPSAPKSDADEARQHPTRQFRDAYEALIEPMINATIKLAEAESLQQNQRAHIEAVEAQLADAKNALARNEAELQAIYGSTSWRIAELIRRAARIVRRPQLAASTLLARCRRQAGAAMSRISAEWREHTATLKRAWTSTRGVIGRRLLWWVARLAGSWRLTWSSPRAMWGVTPILTLPLLAKCDRLLGVRSESLVFTVYHTTNSFDINLKGICDAVYRRFPRWATRFHKAVFHLALIRYDVFHTFCDRGLLPATQGLRIEPAELQEIRRHGRRLYAYTYGADVRTRQATLALGPYNLCAECPEPGRFCTCDDERGAGNIEMIRQHATALVSMGDMLAYAPGAWNIHYWPIDTANFQQAAVDWRADRPLRVGHAPNHAHFKGTRHLVSAIERLQGRGYPIELVSVTGVANSEVIALFKSCDVVADQFIAGFHGYTALEAMALGKPVLCYLRNPEAVIDPANCPIINCVPDTLEAALKACLDGDFDLKALGSRSRSYVEHYYSLEAVAIRLGKLYLETAKFPDRINRMISRRVSGLEARLPPLLLGDPPLPWQLAGEVVGVEHARQRLRLREPLGSEAVR
jgi:glycosyltransferase involved in cell wall biosynthesis